MAYEITTAYPNVKGDQAMQIQSLQNTLCNLIDELGYKLPMIGTMINSISAMGATSAGDDSESGTIDS